MHLCMVVLVPSTWLCLAMDSCFARTWNIVAVYFKVVVKSIFWLPIFGQLESRPPNKFYLSHFLPTRQVRKLVTQGASQRSYQSRLKLCTSSWLVEGYYAWNTHELCQSNFRVERQSRTCHHELSLYQLYLWQVYQPPFSRFCTVNMWKKKQSAITLCVSISLFHLKPRINSLIWHWKRWHWGLMHQAVVISPSRQGWTGAAGQEEEQDKL